MTTDGSRAVLKYLIGSGEAPLLWNQKRAAVDLNTVLKTAMLLVPALKTLQLLHQLIFQY